MNLRNTEATQFKPGVSGLPKGMPKPPIGKRRARRLKVAVAMHQAVYGQPEPFEGTSLEWVRAVRDGRVIPNPVQLQAGLAALSFEHPRLAAVAIAANGTLEDLVRKSASDTQIEGRIADLLGEAKPLLAAPPEPAPDVQADAVAALRQRCIALEEQIAVIDDPALQREYAEVRALLLEPEHAEE